MYAAPFDDDNKKNDNSLLDKKKQAHNRTQKIFPKDSFDSEKVNNVLETMKSVHNNSVEEEDNLANFEPMKPPQSAGVQKTINTEHMQNMTNQNLSDMFQLQNQPQPSNQQVEMNNYTNSYINAEDYYKKMGIRHQAYNSSDNTFDSGGNKDLLMEKLNYMIHLLEEQQDERTSNVTEEVVLYSFLGIFIIFIVDSFAKVGKYVR